MAEQAVHDEHAEIKKRAMRRLFVAGALVTAAVVTLTMLNNKPEERPAPVTATESPAVTKSEPVPPPAMPEKVAEEQAVEAPAPEVPTVPDSEAAPATPPPPPQVLNKPSQAAPAAPKARTEAAAVQTTPKVASTDIAAPAKTSVPQAVTISPAPAAKKPAEQMAAESKPAAAPPVKTTEPSAPKGYVLQLGLFSNHENAVQLQKRLAEHGIKSYTETRLHVGPFHSKAEADEAMTKIRSMGINAVLVPTNR